MKKMEKGELKDSQRIHIENQLDAVRAIVRHCSDERMPQGPCRYCLELYRSAINQAIDLGVYE